MFYLGIDIAKVNHVASLLDQDGSILVKAIKFTNSNEGLQKLLDSISEYDFSQIYCAMEATGTYWLSLFSALTDKGFICTNAITNKTAKLNNLLIFFIFFQFLP